MFPYASGMTGVLEDDRVLELGADFAAHLYETLSTSGERPLNLQLPDLQNSSFEVISEVFGLSDFEQMVLFMALCMKVRSGLMLRSCAIELELADSGQTLSAFLCPYVLQQWFGDIDLGVFADEASLCESGLIRLIPSQLAPANTMLHSIELTAGALSFLQGEVTLSVDVQGFVQPLSGGAWLGGQQQEVLHEVVEVLAQAARVGEVPVFNLYGLHLEAALEVCQMLPEQTAVFTLSLGALTRLIGQEKTTVEAALNAVYRDMTLLGGVLVVEVESRPLSGEGADGEMGHSGWSELFFLQVLCERTRSPVLLLSEAPLNLSLSVPMYVFEVEKAGVEEQTHFWAEALGISLGVSTPLDLALMQVATQFSFSSSKIQSVALEVRRKLGTLNSPSDLTIDLWEACKRYGRKGFQGIADQIHSKANWDRLILPPEDLQTLHEIVTHVHYRHQVYQAWNYGPLERGLGITVLFSGTSGGGKTFAAEVLATALNLDLFRIDLSSIASKWIGETEKNLKKVFDAADEGGAILLFDEADSVFGKRGDAQSSNDRYANLTTNYLLQRMEAYRGLAILTTNFEGNIDSAFMRRIRFTVRFREPDEALRYQLWQRAFPPSVQVEALDYGVLAQARLTGANIRSVALAATFLAAARNSPVTMALLEETISRELKRQGKLMLS